MEVYIVELREQYPGMSDFDCTTMFVASSPAKALDYIKANSNPCGQDAHWWWVVLPEVVDSSSLQVDKVVIYDRNGNVLSHQPIISNYKSELKPDKIKFLQDAQKHLSELSAIAFELGLDSNSKFMKHRRETGVLVYKALIECQKEQMEKLNVTV